MNLIDLIIYCRSYIPKLVNDQIENLEKLDHLLSAQIRDEIASETEIYMQLKNKMDSTLKV